MNDNMDPGAHQKPAGAQEQRCLRPDARAPAVALTNGGFDLFLD